MISIIIATIGRPSLRTTLLSLQGHLKQMDEVLVMGDGDPAGAADMLAESGLPGRYIPVDGPNNNFGHTPRNIGMELAQGTHLMFIDDDDFYLSFAMDDVRRAIRKNPDRPLIFKMLRPGPKFRDMLWTTREVREGNVSTQMIVAPNIPEKLGQWGNRYQGDFDFIESTLKHYPAGPVWREEVLAAWGNPA